LNRTNASHRAGGVLFHPQAISRDMFSGASERILRWLLHEPWALLTDDSQVSKKFTRDPPLIQGSSGKALIQQEFFAWNIIC